MVKFLKKGIKENGQYFPAWYSQGEYTEQSGIQKGTITIYAKSYKGLPSALSPKNDSDSMTDYFEKDRARVAPGSPNYKAVLSVLKGRRL
jgi:hypothetical protein